MKSAALKIPKKEAKPTARKKRKMADLKPPTRDTISETISFVIKGKLTPIKPILIENKMRLLAQKTKKIGKVLKKRACNVKVKALDNPKTKKKCLSKTGKKANAINAQAKKQPASVKKSPKKTKAEKPTKMKGKPKKTGPKVVKTEKDVKSEKKSASEMDDDLQKQLTIQKLLKQANRDIKSDMSVSKKIKKEKIAKSTKTISKEPNLTKPADKKVAGNKSKTAASKPEKPPKDQTKSDDLPAKNDKIKSEPASDTEKSSGRNPVKNLDAKPPFKKVKAKKRVAKSTRPDERCKKKLFGFWNGPKRHRVASLNALAKVHCLYENETRANMLDESEPAIKKEFPRESIKKEIKEEESDASSEDPPASTRTLRSVPGLRGVGKHWDMQDTSSSSSSSEEDSDSEEIAPAKRNIKKEKPTGKEKGDKTLAKRRRKDEIMMDLKDMVVRKRMASLNASAILAASYSAEKRTKSSGRNDGSSSSDTGSSEEYFAASDDEKEDAKREEGVAGVGMAPNKKVAVILNQDTDVTITGVYVNSTTRSTHHEGFCSIAGMQYRISATSHTQTAATAVATETLLQSSASSAPDNSNSDSMPSSKSYTPLDALSNMQPPPGPGHQVLHGQQHMGPPQHVLPMPPHQLSPSLRHGCTSAFSSPHSSGNYTQIPPGIQGDHAYVHGYYQPAGPLITVPHGHSQPPPTKSAPLSEESPLSTTPSATHEPPPPPNSSNGDSSDSEVIITSVTSAKDNQPPPQPAPTAYHRFGQYSSATAPPPYSYSYPASYHHYPTPPPPHGAPYHDFCYPAAGQYVHHKYPAPPPPPPPLYRRYHQTSSAYYAASPPDAYPAAPGQPSQQVVTVTPAAGSGGGFPAAPAGPPPPPTLIETYPTTQPLVETYQPPPHYFPPAYGSAPPCYSHSPSRAIPYINAAAYQSCPCPMQSCPKNVHTGPLTGDSKRSSLTTISKDSVPLPPVALALPLEPASATGPPSPARGSAGMPPPPSPAGATYHQPQPAAATKREAAASPEPHADDPKVEQHKRKARVGKAMVRSSMQNTMLLMCNPSVKREIESPKFADKKDEPEVKVPSAGENANFYEDPEGRCDNADTPTAEKMGPKVEGVAKEKENFEEHAIVEEEILQPVVNTVAENVKVKNMKRKLSVTVIAKPDPEPMETLPKKRQKIGSYKYLIKDAKVRILNGKRKLVEENCKTQRRKRIKIKLKKPTTKRKLRKSDKKCLKQSGVNNNEKLSRVSALNRRLSSIKRSSVTALNNLFAKNNVDRIIESIVCESNVRTVQNKTTKCGKNNGKKIATEVNVNDKKVTNDDKKKKPKEITRRRSKCKEQKVIEPQVISKAPRRSLHLPRWSNGWAWEGEPYEAKVFLNSDETTVLRKCYPAMRHQEGDQIMPRDCVLLKAGPRKNDLPFVAKIASLWENPEDGEMMMSLLWYYRPEHTEQGRLPNDQTDEVFASRHKDSNSVACIDDKCFVLTFNEYCRYRKNYKRLEEGIEETLPCIPNPEPYPRARRQPLASQISPEMVFFCRRVYDFRQKRLMKNPT